MSEVKKESVPAAIWRWIGLIQHGILRVFGLILIFLFLMMWPALLQGEPDFKLADSGVLYFEPAGPIVEELTEVSPSDALAVALSGGSATDEILLSDVVSGLRHAAQDEDVTALVMRLDTFGGATPAALHIVGQELTALREAGKEVIAYADNYANSSWFLAAHADEVHMSDMGFVGVNGFALYRTYYRSLLDRLNITMNIYRVGTYKSALEPFLGDEMSPEDEAQRRFLFEEIWDAYKSAAASGRELSASDIQAYGDGIADLMTAAGGDYTQIALDQGFVDQTIGRGTFFSDLANRFGADDETNELEATDFLEYASETKNEEDAEGDQIAVIYAVGTILAGEGDGGTIGGDIHARLIRKARLDDDVRAIVLRIDSGGGSAFASELIREELELARLEGKPVIASMGGVAASGGYWIATPANQILAEPTTITGSIGIFSFIPTAENAMAEIGVFEDGFGTTASAGGLSLVGGVSDINNVLLQTAIEHGYDQFLNIVAEGRNMTVEEVNEVAQGRVWTGLQALDRGLVDQIGGFDDAVALAAELAELDDYAVTVFKEEVDPVEELLKMLGFEAVASFVGDSTGNSLLSRFVGETAQELDQLNLLNDPNHIYATCLECQSLRQMR